MPDIVPVVEFLLAHRVEGIIFAPPQMGANIKHVMEQLPPGCPPVVFLKAEPTHGVHDDRHRQLGRRAARHRQPPARARADADRPRRGPARVARGARPPRRLAGRLRKAGLEPGPMAVSSWSSAGGADGVRAAPRRGPGDRRAVRGQRPDRARRAPRRQRARDPDPRAARGRRVRRAARGAPSSRPSLTTVRQPLAEHGHARRPGARRWPWTPRPAPTRRAPMQMPVELIVGDSAPLPSDPPRSRPTLAAHRQQAGAVESRRGRHRLAAS